MRIIAIAVLAILLAAGASAQRYVPYASVQDHFNEKYQGALDARAARLPPPPASYVDPASGQLFVFRQFLQGTPVVQNTYYRMNDQAVPTQIDTGSYDDGYNMGYFKGYDDGIALRPRGYEAYIDYTETHKSQILMQRQGYYQLSDKQVKVTVTASSNPYNNGYNDGRLQGFKDAFYDVAYQGKNRAYYLNQAMVEKYPGSYQAVPPQTILHNQYRTFPAFGYYTGGNIFYGFNYR